MQLETVIGLEIHVQLRTKSKMFCACANIFGDVPPNSAVCPICMGYPGTLPVPNKTAIEWTQRAGAALGCELATRSKFDRKSYFYPDLPKGYQISQYDQPFCGKGHLEVTVAGEPRMIGITRIHLEEDAAKNVHMAEQGVRNPGDKVPDPFTLIDYNRSGTPLMEIVTEPDLRTPEEAKFFLQELQRIMRTLDVSDANMEQGQLRCDANISLRKQGSPELYPKTEIKNLNSFRNVERALQYEIKRQTEEWEGVRGQEGVRNPGDKVPDPLSPPDTLSHQQTRGFNADTGKTTVQRTKEAAADYRYFPEPDIPPFVFTQAALAATAAALPELPHAKRERFMSDFSISAQQAQLLSKSPDLARLFEETTSELQQLEKEETSVLPEEIKTLVQLAANIILRHVRELMSANKLRYDDLKITPQNLAELIVLIHQHRVNKNALAEVLAEMQRTGGDPDPIIEKLGVASESGEDLLAQYVDEVIAANAEVVAKIKAGKEGALQFLMGQVMAKSKGKANPGVIIEMLKKRI